jgi:hypothetical protein
VRFGSAGFVDGVVEEASGRRVVVVARLVVVVTRAVVGGFVGSVLALDPLLQAVKVVRNSAPRTTGQRRTLAG